MSGLTLQLRCSQRRITAAPDCPWLALALAQGVEEAEERWLWGLPGAHLLLYSCLQFRGCLGHFGLPNPGKPAVSFQLPDSPSEGGV